MHTLWGLRLCCAVVALPACSIDAVTFTPTGEDCQVVGDEDHNGKADCEDPACTGAPSCQPDAPSQICYGASNGLVRPCFLSAPAGDLTLPPTVNTTDSPLCSTEVMDVPAHLCVIARANITISSGTVSVVGTRPLVLVATSTIS